MILTGNFWDFFAVFAAGVLVSFTPCIYPVMPLTASCIAGANIHGSRLKGFILSLIYVFGMALTYSALAVAAALTGKVFGQLQNQPFMYGIIFVILLFFSLVMFDVVQLSNFGFLVQAKERPRNLLTVFLFGITSGFIIGPCTAPMLGLVLLHISSKQNLLYGILLMFFYAYGVGFSLILIGTFSGLLSSLPKSGKWMLWVKRGCGGIILVIAAFFLFRALGIL